jgi:hypothetical protein
MAFITRNWDVPEENKIEKKNLMEQFMNICKVKRKDKDFGVDTIHMKMLETL